MRGFTLIRSDLYGWATLRMGFLSYIYISEGVDGLSEVVVGSITATGLKVSDERLPTVGWVPRTP